MQQQPVFVQQQPVMVQQPVMMGAPQPQVVVVNNAAPAEKKYEGCCGGAMIECSEGMAWYFFIMNILSPGVGTFWSSCCDRKGCNCAAFLLAHAQGGLAVIIVGWIWSIWWGWEMIQWNKGRN